jgi:pimeloyl-ACP methyl ester carboxylesterase
MKKETKRAHRQGVDAQMRAPSALLLALEGRAFFEWAACVAAWPLLSQAARGDGHPVLVLPGLAASDSSTWPLRKFLEGRGYAVYPWEQGLNCGPREGVVRKVLAQMRRIQREHGRKLSLVGWSLGGAMAHALAVREPQRVRSVITLGSPLGGNPKASNAWRLFEFVSGLRADDPRLRALMSRSPCVPSTSILSKSDGIVAWCRQPNNPKTSRSVRAIWVSAPIPPCCGPLPIGWPRPKATGKHSTAAAGAAWFMAIRAAPTAWVCSRCSATTNPCGSIWPRAVCIWNTKVTATPNTRP